jgi:hypothetical protein
MQATRLLPGNVLDPRLVAGPRRIGAGRRRGEPGYPPILLPHPGPCADHPTLVICLFDNSGSVTGGNDPIGNRFLEIKIAVKRVGRRCRCRQELVAILHFDRGTGGDAGPVALDRQGQAELDRALAIPVRGFGISELGPSLTDAYRLAKALPGHRATLIAFTDFELFDGDLSRVLDEFCSFPGAVHAAVLRSEPPPRLTADPSVMVTRILLDSRPGAVARAAFDALTMGRRPLAVSMEMETSDGR